MATFCEEMMMMMEENDIELNLGLSLGGSFMKSEKSISSSAINEKSGETEADLRSILFPISDSVFREEKKTQIEREVLDPKRKRKILALRRREKKQKMLLETQAEQSRVRDRDSIENETSGSEQICKKAKTDEEEDQGSKQSQSPNRSSSAFVPVVPMQYPFPHLQYVPFSNGFGIPYTVPYWTDPAPVSVSAAAVVGDEKNVFQPVATRAFRPFQAQNAIANRNRSVSCDSEQNGSNGGGLKQVQSSLCSSGGSLRSGSSGVSDYQSSSNQGISSSSDTRSHSTSSQPTEPFAQGIEEPDQKAKKTGQGKPISIDKTITIDKPITITDNPTPPRSPTDQPSHHQTPREAKGEVANKPPKPPQPPQNQQPSKTQALPHMPCVSTTGDGPNGKTISGFLYRYTKTQVSIMCVCHGSSFTPAEFVEHAGGTDVLNPLKHIVVVPSTF